MHVNILWAIVIASWIVACVSCGVSIIRLVGYPNSHMWLPVAFAFIATGLGYLGYGRWSPFRFFPQLGWMWSSDSFEVYISSSALFLAPLTLGTAALLLGVWKGSRSRHR